MVLSQLYIAETENKGRGVFTSKAIKAGTIIETSPVVVMTRTEHLILKNTLLRNYVFEWDPPGRPKMCCLAMGWIELYNHSYESNSEHHMDYKNTSVFIQTVRDIKAGEEITINYNGKWDNKFLVWFDRE